MTDLSLDPITGVIKAIASMATSPIKNQLERNERVIELRKKFNLDPDHPPADFTGVYRYALVEYGIDKPQPIIELFRQKEIIQAFRQAFERNDRSVLLKEEENFFDWNILGNRIRELNINIQQELADFQAVFINIAKSTRTPAAVIQSQKIDNLENILKEVANKLMAIPSTTLDELWKQLLEKATKADRIKLEIVNNLGMWNPAPKVPKGTPFHFLIYLETAGYLILLEKNPEHQIWCLSPSCLSPPSRLEAGEVKLPLAYQDTFTTDSIGREQIVAIISQNRSNLDWLPNGNDEPLEMKKENLIELLEYLKSTSEVQILCAEYRVTE